MIRHAIAYCALGAASIVSGGCDRHGDKVASPPVAVPVAVDFPSQAAAIAADTVLMFVVNNPAAQGVDCLSLVDDRVHGKDLPKGTATSSGSVCALQNEGPAAIPLAFGMVAVLAVAQRNQKDFLIGCSIEHVDGATELLSIPLTLVDSAEEVPTTSCATLSQHCSNSCPAAM